ncbi:MAG: glycosyltransferase family 4 protein [Snowella sp.]|nr:glycosyltransferase family 4 protein [Snowella sp.]
MSIKIGILFKNFGPYHFARIEGCINSFKNPPIEVIPIELGKAQTEYAWVTEHRKKNYPIVSVIEDEQLEKVNPLQLVFKLNQALNKLQPDVLAIAGYFELGMLFALIWCLWHRKSIILLSESMENDAPRFQLRELIKQKIIQQYDAALVGGTPHKRYFAKLGMPSQAIFLGYDVVGNHAFHPALIGHLPRPLNNPYFLAVNRFIPKKNLAFLIDSYAIYRQQKGHEAWHLVLSGEGELRSEIEQKIKQLGLTDWVHLTGFLQQEELLPYFAHASCFIHASIQEQWGLVVNEAMAAGLPVLVSNRCGCFEDLVLEGINGFGFDPTDQQALTELMLKMSSSEVDLSAMGQASLQHIQQFSPDFFAQGLKQAVEYSLAFA